MNREVSVIVSGPRGTGKSAIVQLIRGILRAAHVEYRMSNPQEILDFGDMSTGKPYEVLAALKPTVLLIEDRNQAYVDFENQKELEAFKKAFPSALYLPQKRSFADPHHNIAFAAWALGRDKLRHELMYNGPDAS